MPSARLATPVAAELSWADVHAFRLQRHHLIERAPKSRLAQVVGEICGAQAQVMSSAELQIAVRVDCTVEDVRRALWQYKTLVKTWLMRGTLHLMRSTDLPIYTAAMGPYTFRNLSAWLRYLELTESELNELLDRIGSQLDGTPKTREELISVAGRDQSSQIRQFLRSGWGGILKPLARRGWLCFGPSRGQSVTFVRPQAWLDTWRRDDPDDALVDCARRYLRAYGPADKNDFTRWLGMWRPGIGMVAWTAMERELVTVSVEGRRLQLLKSDLRPLRATQQRSSVQLLPGFDPYLMGHANRDHLFDAVHRGKVSRVAGWISPVVLVNGRVEGVWSHSVAKGRLLIDVAPFKPLARAVLGETKDRADLIAAALGTRLDRVAVS